MQLYSTNNPNHIVSLKEAVFKSLPQDNGLYMPLFIPQLSSDFFKHLPQYSFQAVGFEICKALFQETIPEHEIYNIIEKAITFPAPVIHLDEHHAVLELFHGPSLAFKDFGARFMAQLMSYFNKTDRTNTTILVATSGDTGGAVASGFYQTQGVDVIILYPSGKVSPLQEKQLTTLGYNISAVEVEGTFDDCQALVKQAFLDKELNQKFNLSSANSINIARLIPQSFYYFESYKQLMQYKKDIKVVFSVPSGNFGNLTAGLFAKKMGLPIAKFLAATNINDVVPTYIHTGVFSPRPSTRTISNAMDVGNPSNFTRMLHLYSSTWNNMTNDINGYAYSDKETEEAMKNVYRKYNYILDPHGAVGFLAANTHLQETKEANQCLVTLETAHPAKFLEDVERVLELDLILPQQLAELMNKEKKSALLNNDFMEFKSWLLTQNK
ncbi:MAG: threonine synthase [Saprospiraceae bacterium]|nr:threonine synthase [Saprospiraceae bacterium]